MQPQDDIHLVKMLLARLERVSADSYWAHRASGVRGSLLRILEKMEAGEPVNPSHLAGSLKQGFGILERAAREQTR